VGTGKITERNVILSSNEEYTTEKKNIKEENHYHSNSSV
jgi:hypothetical protein